MASSFHHVIQALKRLPSIGKKSAENIAFYLLESNKQEVKLLTQSIENFIKKTVRCHICGLISEQSPCKICSSSKRSKKSICVVKSIQDALNIERSHSYLGLYHVLGGLISPVNNIDEQDISINTLLKRLTSSVDEIIFALEQTIEAEVTIKIIRNKFKGKKIKLSRIAIGIPIGTELGYIDEITLKKALFNRSLIE